MYTLFMNTKVAFQDIFSDLLGDLEISDSAFGDYLNSLILNLTLKNLDIPSRQEFTQDIINQGGDSIKNYILKKIPDFENMLSNSIAEDVKIGVDHE